MERNHVLMFFIIRISMRTVRNIIIISSYCFFCLIFGLNLTTYYCNDWHRKIRVKYQRRSIVFIIYTLWCFILIDQCGIDIIIQSVYSMRVSYDIIDIICEYPMMSAKYIAHNTFNHLHFPRSRMPPEITHKWLLLIEEGMFNSILHISDHCNIKLHEKQ